MQYDVFLSYSREDVKKMQEVRDNLRADGFAVWTDEGIEPGTPSWKVAIEDALLNTASVVVLFSPSASQSKWVRNELDFAETHRKHIFPMMVRGNEADAIPFGYTSYQWIDIREKSQFETGLTSLKIALRKAQGVPVPEALTTHQLAEAGRSKRLPMPVIIASGFIAIILISLLLNSVFFTDETPEILATERTDEPVSVTETILPSATPTVELTDEPAIESTASLDIPDGWQWVENDSARFIVPENWIAVSQDDFLSIGGQVAEVADIDMASFATIFPENEYLSYANWLTLTGIIFGVDDIGIRLPMANLENRYQLLVDSSNFDLVSFERVQIQQGEALKVQAESIFLEDTTFRYTVYVIPVGTTAYAIGVGGVIPEDEIQSMLDTIMEHFQIKESESD